MRAPRHIAIVLTVLALSACSAGPVTEASPTTVLAAAEQPAAPELTAEQVQYLAAVAWQQAETKAFLESIAAVRAAVPAELRRVMWCEAGTYKGLPAFQTDYAAKTHGHDGASGGAQIVKGTWETWARAVGVDVARWPRAYLAPDFVQDLVATHGWLHGGARGGSGAGHWTASRGCWG